MGGERSGFRAWNRGCARLGPNVDRLSGSVGGIYLMPLGYENEPSGRGIVQKGRLRSALGCSRKASQGGRD